MKTLSWKTGVTCSFGRLLRFVSTDVVNLWPERLNISHLLHHHLEVPVKCENLSWDMSFLKIKPFKQTAFFSCQRAEWAFYDVYVCAPPLCLMHLQCKLSVRPILEIFHLRQTCFPCMWCSLKLLKGVLGLSQENLLTSVRRYSPRHES